MQLIDTVNTATFYHAEADRLLAAHRASADLVFADPPFNIGVAYDSWRDNLTEEAYLQFTIGWMTEAVAAMTDRGSLWVNIPDQWAANIVNISKHFGLKMENWCLWHYRFGTWQPRRFIVSKTHALWFSKGNPIVNVEAAQVPSDRAAVYNDPRALTAGTRMDLDVWGFDQYWGRVQGNNKERCPFHENQLPERYLERVIKVCSAPDSLVIDPFCGSGTTACVGAALGRKCVTGDLSERCIASAAARCRRGAIRVRP